MYTNAQSIIGKLNKLSAYTAEARPDFILLTETWCNPSITNADLSLPGYQLETELREDREDTHNGLGGGLLVYSRQGNKILPLDKNADFHQYLTFKILTTGEPVNIILAYRPPNSRKENVTKLCELLKNMPNRTILIGDINLPNIDWTSGQSDSKGRELWNVVQEENLEQLVTFPTHNKGNVLDLIITNMASQVISVFDDGKLGKSDHSIIIAEIKATKMLKKNKERTPNWNKADYHSIRTYLKHVNWDQLFENKTVEQAWEALKGKLNEATSKFVPLSTPKNPEEPKWLNREIIRLVRKKKRAWKVFKHFNSRESRDKYTELERQVTITIRNAKRGMEKKLASTRDNNSRRFANYIRSKTKTRTSIGPLKTADGVLKTDEAEIAAELNLFFASVFTTEEDNHLPEVQKETESSFGSIDITEEKVKEKIQNLKEHSAAGPDGIGPKILKAAMNELVKPLCYIYRKSLNMGQVPADWRHARVTPIYKKGPKGEPGNYRPVSLTSTICRMLESIIKDGMMAHLRENNLIRDSQHGFLKGKSCTTNLITFMDKLTNAVDNNKSADVFYLDFAKAFDKVPHQKLLLKMRSKGINGEVYAWISAWLSNRTQTVRVGESESTASAVKSGVPQGSVLGPPLFDVFIDDLDDCAELLDILLKFADDTKGMKEITGIEDNEKLQQSLDKLVSWAEKWGMQYNIPKCKIMHVGKNNPRHEYFMAGNKLTVVDEEKDVGVTVHKSLKPARQCKKAAGIAGAVLRQLTRNFHYRDKNIFKTLYVQYVRPHVEFAAPAWSPWLREDIETIEKVQRKAVGMISGMKGRSYEEKCRELGIETLEERRKKQDLFEAFKIMKGPEPNNAKRILQRQETRNVAVTRNSTEPWNILVQRSRLDIRKYGFTGRTTDAWNKLPSELKAIETLPKFKNAIKLYLTPVAIGGRPDAS